jgi:hypothetical protein
MPGSQRTSPGASRLRRGLGLGLIVLAAIPARSEPGSSHAPEHWLSHLRPGQWIKVEGRLDAHGGLRARELKFIAGDRDEAQVTTSITSIDPLAKSFRTSMGIQVVTDRRTEVQGKENHQASFSALQPGVRVEAEGKLRKDGAFLAEEVEIQKTKKGGDSPDDDEITGRIESVDGPARKVVLLGIPVFFDDRTKLKSPVPD